MRERVVKLTLAGFLSMKSPRPRPLTAMCTLVFPAAVAARRLPAPTTSFEKAVHATRGDRH